MTTETLQVTQDFTTLDLLLWRRFGQEAVGAVEKTMKANQDLAEFGPYLPVGTKVELEIEAVKSAPVIRVVRLWG